MGLGLDQCISGPTHNKGRIALKHIGTCKDRAHKKFKKYSRIEGNTQNIFQSEMNFKYKRQLFKNMCNKK